MTHSQNKGKNGEREWSKKLRSLGFKADRACQLGVKDGRDVISECLPNVFFEVKRVESLDLGTQELWEAWMQAKEKADVSKQSGAQACVAWRQNHKTWRLTFMDDKRGLVTVYRDQDIKANLVMLNGGGK